MSACTKHAAEPVRGYSDCPGCEVESLRQQLAAAQAEIECEERRFSEQQDLLHSVIQERDAAKAEARELREENKAGAKMLAQYIDQTDETMRLVWELRERAEKAERDYRWMVERAADQHLSGYRELARRAADAENVADGLRAELARVREALTHIKRVMGPKVPPCCDGCAAEWQETLDTANTALAAGGE